MKFLSIALLALSLGTTVALADPWKDESGKGRWRTYDRFGGWEGSRERKVKLRTSDGCEVERKWKKGEYEEKIKCKPNRYGYRY